MTEPKAEEEDKIPTLPEAGDREGALGDGGFAVVHLAEHLEPEEGQLGTGHVELHGFLAPRRVQSIILCTGDKGRHFNI